MIINFPEPSSERPLCTSFLLNLEEQKTQKGKVKNSFVTSVIPVIEGPLRRSVHRSGYYLSFLLKLLTV